MSVANFGNGNIEVARVEINKADAIRSVTSQKQSGTILLLGDNENDRPLVNYPEHDHRAASCLVFHSETPRSLLHDVTFAVNGSAQGIEILRTIAQLKQGRLLR